MRRTHPQRPGILPKGVWLLLLGTSLWAGCRRAASTSLPPRDNLHAYSLAVAERARRLVRDDWYLPVYDIGKVHERFGFESRALEAYERAVELEPNAYEVHNSIGFILSQGKDRLREAVETYQRSLLSNPNQNGIYTRIGLVLIHQGSQEKAVEVLEHEIHRGGATVMTYYNLGQAYKQQKKHEEAVENYRLALRKDPRMREALYGLSQSLLVLGRQDEAAGPLEEFRKLKVESDERERRAKARQTDVDDHKRYAADTWERAAELFLRESGHHRGAGKRRRFVQLALAAMEKALEFDEQRETAHRFLIDHHHQRKNLERALDYGKRAVKALPRSPALLYRVATLYLESAPKNSRPDDPSPEVEEAIALLDQALEYAPDSAVTHREIAQAILFRNRQKSLLKKALIHARKALELTESPRAINYDLIAMACLFSGDEHGALDSLRKGVRRFPGDANLKERLRLLEEQIR